MTPDEKLSLDVRDFWRVHDGLEAYAHLDTRGAMDRLRTHKEDALCEVADYSGSGKLMCARDGYNAIIEVAERHRESLPVPGPTGVRHLARAINCKSLTNYLAVRAAARCAGSSEQPATA